MQLQLRHERVAAAAGQLLQRRKLLREKLVLVADQFRQRVAGLADGGCAVLRLADDSGVGVELQLEGLLLRQVEQNSVLVFGHDRLGFNE